MARTGLLTKDEVSDFFWSTDTRKSVSVSVMFHLIIVIMIVLSTLSFETEDEPVDEQRVLAFDLPGPFTGSRETSSIPQIAPAPTQEVVSEAEEVVPPVVVPSDVTEEATPPSGPGGIGIGNTPGGGGEGGDGRRVWTPPPPNYDAVTGSTKTDGVEGSRVLLPTVSFDGMGKDPVLVDYEMGRFDGSEALLEATRLSRNGRMKMTVQIAENGIPAGCTTVETSGSNVLDSLGCGLVMSYVYEPALNAQGEPKAAVIYEVLEWSSGRDQDGSSPKRPLAGVDADEDGFADEDVVPARPKLDEDGNRVPNSLDADLERRPHTL